MATGRTVGLSRKLTYAGKAYGLDVERLWQSVRGVPRYIAAADRYRRLRRGSDYFPITVGGLQPHLADAFRSAGDVDREYFYQDWWVAREVFRTKPRRHLDIGSRLDGFVGHLLVFRDVEFVDVRDIDLDVPGFSSIASDARYMDELQSEGFDSISCLHAIEHVGLGRYGDPIDPGGSHRVAAEICRLLEPGGRAYVSSPIGRGRLEFNGQRVFDPIQVSDMFASLRLERFSAVDDEGVFHEDSDPGEFVDARDACGIFVFRKARVA